MVEVRLRPDFDVLAVEHLAELAKKPEHRSSTTRLQSFVLALKKIQEREYDDHFSFFWLASYHGGSSERIYVKQRALAGRPSSFVIFCSHGVPTFPGWHRVYLHRFEQALQQEDPTVMLPFWNQLSEVSMKFGYNELIAKEKFELVSGELIDNPLYSFYIQDDIYTGNNSSLSLYRRAGPTVRNSEHLVNYINTRHGTLVKEALKATDYMSFSTTSNTSGETSLEEPHNNIHDNVGGEDDQGVPGHMSTLELSAFDPIFWLHHCYIDYLFWHWQVDHNQTTQLIMPDQVGNSLLDPFRKSDGNFYTLFEMASIEQFGYNYQRLDINLKAHSANTRRFFLNLKNIPFVHKSESSRRSLLINGIKFAKFGGSFSVKAIAYTAGGRVNLGRNAVFHAASACDNCLVNDSTKLHYRLKNIKQEHESKIRFKIRFYLQGKIVIEFSINLTAGLREYKHFYGTTLELSY